MNTELTELIDQLRENSFEARENFGKLTIEQLNWKPSPTEWSVAQCIEHLIVTNQGLLPVVNKLALGEYKPTFKERLPILPRIFGAMLLSAVKPQSTRKFKAGKKLQPASSDVGADVLTRFEVQHSELADRMQSADKVDLHKVIVTSPVSSLVTYSLFDAYRIIIAHEQRHLLQAKRVTAREGFPAT